MSQPTPVRVHPAFSALVGLTTLLILLQAVWAGIFLRNDGQRATESTWIDVHAQTGYASIVLALAAAGVAFATMRARRDLWVASLVLAALLVLETALGVLIADGGHTALTIVHIPLAMLIMGIAVALPLRARLGS